MPHAPPPDRAYKIPSTARLTSSRLWTHAPHHIITTTSTPVAHNTGAADDDARKNHILRGAGRLPYTALVYEGMPTCTAALRVDITMLPLRSCKAQSSSDRRDSTSHARCVQPTDRGRRDYSAWSLHWRPRSNRHHLCPEHDRRTGHWRRRPTIRRVAQRKNGGRC